MEITEVLERKKAIEMLIVTEIEAFEKDTGLEIDSIDMHETYVNGMSPRERGMLVIELDIRL